MAEAEPRVLAAVLAGRCSRCGEGALFAGYLKIAPACSACGFDYAIFDVGDGATVFVILIVGFIVCAAALIVEVKFAPPYWVQAVPWLPLIVILVLGGLRLAKSALIVLQYRHRAGEGRLAE